MKVQEVHEIPERGSRSRWEPIFTLLRNDKAAQVVPDPDEDLERLRLSLTSAINARFGSGQVGIRKHDNCLYVFRK